jgi:hypothetical protein
VFVQGCDHRLGLQRAAFEAASAHT